MEKTNAAAVKKTHWKRIHNPDYIGAYSLDDGAGPKDLTVTIENVGREMVTGEGGKKDECIVARLKGQKPMILNVTNCKTLTALYNTPYVEDWKGKTMTLFVAQTNLKGEVVECLRIRPGAPKSLPELTIEHEKWETVKTALQNETATIEQARTRFVISNENHIKLVELQPGHLKWSELQIALFQNTTTIEDVKEHYTISEENEFKILNDAI